MTLTVANILTVFTSRTYLKQKRNELYRSGNMFCVLQVSLHAPSVSSTLPPFSLAKISHTLALSSANTHSRVHSLNLAQPH